MTHTQFVAIATLMRMREGKTKRAASLVLVFGVRPGEAARITGLSPASVSNAVTRFRKAQALASLGGKW